MNRCGQLWPVMAFDFIFSQKTWIASFYYYKVRCEYDVASCARCLVVHAQINAMTLNALSLWLGN